VDEFADAADYNGCSIESETVPEGMEHKKLIAVQRFRNEGLRFVDRVEEVGEDGNTYVRSTIADADGVVYEGILHDDGTVEENDGRYDSVETWERVQGPFEILCSYWRDYNYRHEIVRDQNGSLYFHHYRTNVCPSDEIVAIKDANHLAECPVLRSR